jgi:hypothetical protein
MDSTHWRELLEKAALGALIPLVQFLWRFWSMRTREARKKQLRESAIALQAFLAQLSAGPATATTPAAIAETTRELDDVLRRLAAMSAESAALTQTSQSNLGLRRLVTGGAASARVWFARVAFFALLALMIATWVLPDEDGELGTLGRIAAMALYSPYLLVTGWLAASAERPFAASTRRHSKARSLLLLYRPARARYVGVHLLFYLTLAMVVVMTGGVYAAWEYEERMPFMFTAVIFLLLAGMVRWCALALDQQAKAENASPAAELFDAAGM